MGNEHSKNKEPTKNGTIPEKHENGAVNGFSANITSNGLEIGVNSDTIIQQNGKPTSLNPATESNEPDYVIVESDCQHVDAQVISEAPDTTVQKEEVKKNKEEKNHLFGKMFKKKAEPPAAVPSVQEKETSNEDQTDISLPATDPQPESDSSGEEAAATIIVEHPEEFECPHQKAEISTQTDVKTEADTSTQTGYDSDSTTNTEGPIEEVAVMETATTEEHSLNESAVIIAEEAVEDTANEEPSDNQTAGIIITEVVNIGNNVYENIVFRAERVEVTDNFEISHIKNYNSEEESINGPEETEPEITTEPELNPNESIIVDEIAAEENMIEESVPLEVFSSLPKVVADCIEAVFAAVSESSDYAAVNMSEPRVDEVITEDNDEGAGDIPADVAMIETAEPEPNAVTPEAGEANGVPSLDGEPVTKVMETIFEVVYEEPNTTPGDQDMPVEEPSPLETEILVKMESAHEEVTADDAAAADDVPENLSPLSDDEPSEKKCDSNPKEEITTVGGIVEASSKEIQLIAIEELPEDSLTSPDDKSIPEIIITEVDVGEDVMAGVAPETDEVSEVSSAIVKEDTEVILEAAIDALSEELEPSTITPPEPAADNASPLEEEVFAATFFVALSAEQKASLTIPDVAPETDEESEVSSAIVKEDAEVILEAAIDALSEELEPSTIIPPEPAADNAIPLEEEVFAATVFVPLSAEQKASLTIPDVAPETDVESEISSAIVKEDAEVIPEAAIDALSEELELSAETPLESAADNASPLEEEVFAATVFVALSAEQNASLTIPDVAPKTVEESEFSSAIVKEDAEVTPEAAIDSLSEELEPSTITPPEPAADNASPLEEEVFAATVFVPLSAEQKASLTIPDVAPETDVESEISSAVVKEDAEVTPEAAIDALSEELELSAETPLESAADNASPLEEEVFAATVFVALSAEQKASLTIPDVAPETVEESEVSSAIVKEDAEVTPEAAIDALSTELEPSTITPPEPAADNASPLEEEVFAATVFVALSAEQKTSLTILEEPETIIPSKDEIVDEETKEEAIQALSNESEAVPQRFDEDTAVQETSTEGQVAISEEPVDDSDVTEEKNEVSEDEPLTEATEKPVEESIAPVEVLLEDADKEAVSPSVVAVEVLESSPVVSEEAVEESVSPLEQQPKADMLVVILETTEYDFTEEKIHETDYSGDVLAAVVDNTEDSQIAAVDESVAACVEAIVEAIITEDVGEAECNPVTSEVVVPEIVTEAEENAEDESRVNTTVPSPDHQENMEALLVKLPLACASVVEESAYKLSGLAISSLGYSITVTIHVAPKTEQQ